MSTTMSERYDEPAFDTADELIEETEEAREEMDDLIRALLDTDLGPEDVPMDAVRRNLVRKARRLEETREQSLSMVTTHRKPGRNVALEHKRREKLRRGTRRWDTAYTEWICFDRADVLSRVRDREELVAEPDWAIVQTALLMAEEAGFDVGRETSRGVGDTFRDDPTVQVRGSRVLVTARGGLDV